MRVVVVVTTRRPTPSSARASAYMSVVLPPPPARLRPRPGPAPGAPPQPGAGAPGRSSMTNAVTAYLDVHVAAGRGGRTAIVTPTGSHTYPEVLAATCPARDAPRALGGEPAQ